MANQEFVAYCQEMGVENVLTLPYPQRAELLNWFKASQRGTNYIFNSTILLSFDICDISTIENNPANTDAFTQFTAEQAHFMANMNTFMASLGTFIEDHKAFMTEQRASTAEVKNILQSIEKRLTRSNSQDSTTM